MRFAIRTTVFVAATHWALLGLANETQKGHLLIIGGGLRPDNAAVFQRLIRYAGGEKTARLGILPTASVLDTDAEQTKLILGRMGVPTVQIRVLDIHEVNAPAQVVNPKIIEQIRGCSGIYFEGGDQTRITRALTDARGAPTPALQAIYEVWNNGAVIAGSSAGAAARRRSMFPRIFASRTRLRSWWEMG